jgi:putative restriction endonuclease
MHATDDAIRSAAGAAIVELVQARGTNVLRWTDIAAGFNFCNEKVLFANRAVGIFKPKQLNDGAALSIKQVNPSRAGRVAPYDDRELGEGIVVYRLERSRSDSHYNEYLFVAHRRSLPLIFFRGVSDAEYEVLYPVFVRGIDMEKQEALVAINESSADTRHFVEAVEEPLAREYSTGVRKSRLHQRAFRQRVLLAYGLKCALTGLPIPELLEAAHIIPDSKGGEASVSNGIALSTIHHAAYEGDLLGIDPDGKIHLSERIKRTRDGPMFDHGLRQLDGRMIRFPLFEAHRPNRDFLARRYEEFVSQAS